MTSTAIFHKQVKGSLVYLNFFYKKYIATYNIRPNITRVCILVIMISYLTSFGINYSPCMPASASLINIVYLYFLRKGLELEGGRRECVARENLLSVMKVIY